MIENPLSAAIQLRPARESEMPALNAMDQQPHANRFVLQTGLKRHLQNFADPDITYLVIERHRERCGYSILVPETDNHSVELRRILIDQHHRGVGQTALAMIERYCYQRWQAKRIWLDVFSDNPIARHIYQKSGYQPFRKERHETRRLLFLEKTLQVG